MNRLLGLSIVALMGAILIVFLMTGVPQWYALGPIIVAGAALIYSENR